MHQVAAASRAGAGEGAPDWAAIDRELVDEALRVWLYHPHIRTVLAARAGSYQFHPYWGLLTGLVWVRCESR